MIDHLYAIVIVITYNVIINSTRPKYILHILHGHPSEMHLSFNFEFESIERLRFFRFIAY